MDAADKRRRTHPAGRWLAFAAVAALGVAAGSARADTRITRFPTFVHVGPGMEYAVSDELQTHVPVDVVGCRDKWCQIRMGTVYGWVTQNILTSAPQPIVPTDGRKPSSCFDFARSGWPNGGDLDNLCIYEGNPQK